MHHRLLTGLVLGALASLAAPARPQGGGFVAGDLYVYGWITAQTTLQGVARLHPASGNCALIAQFQQALDHQGAMAFDPYRQRLLYGRWQPSISPYYTVTFSDAAGQLTPLPFLNAVWDGIAPVGDGRIYYHDSAWGLSSFRWLDAANQVHILMSADGVTPWDMDGAYTVIDDMIYSASENALIIVSVHDATKCPGEPNSVVHLRKIQLSADGTRVLSTLCNITDVNPNDGETTRGLNWMPDGDLLLGTHNGLYGPPLPRLIRVHPGDLSSVPFAFIGDGSNLGSTWSTALNRAVLQSHFTSKLMAYQQGQVNNGAQIASDFSFPGQSTVLEEIPSLACDGGWIAYGTGLAGKGGFVPRLYGSGCAKVGGAFSLKMDQVVGGAGGSLFVGLAPASVPFKGGKFLVGAVTLNVAVGVGGAAGVAGAGSLTLPAGLPANPLLQGVSIYLQAAFSDSAAVKGVSLTQGLEMEIG